MLGSLIRWIDITLHPEWYHGSGKRPPFFEGWYYKLISADQVRRYAIIPGIFLSDDPARHHAFVQVFDGMSGHATYHRYPPEAFHAEPGNFDVRIGSNRFRLDHIDLDIDDEQRCIKGTLNFGVGEGWPVSVTSPGVMGWFGWVPIMECYHGVLRFDHLITGNMSVNGEVLDFSGGRGYIEKDWGKSFPAGWVWMQTNHFSQPGISFSASIAIVPSPLGWFPGFLAGIRMNGSFYRFATYTGAKVIKLEVSDHSVLWVMQDGNQRLEVYGIRGESTMLPGPTRLEMGARVPETLKSSIQLCLTDLNTGKVIFNDTGECAGLEVAGDIERLLEAVSP